MWNPVERVAKHQGLDQADLVDFALSRDNKYGIIIEGGVAKVSNLSVENLLADFKHEQDERDDAIVAYGESMPHVAGVDIGCEFDPVFTSTATKNRPY
jgi:hypothetical protein